MKKITKAILTGGGRATRLFPLTANMNKHVIPLANKPMIFHAIERVVEAGIREIFINTNPGDTSLAEVVGDGGHWGIQITYFEQTGGPQGIAHVVNEAKKFIGDDPFMFYLSDNILLGGVKEIVEEFNSGNYDCMLALSEVSDPQRFGVPYFNKDGALVDVIEKPENPPNNFAVTGIYLYGPELFFNAFEQIEKSPRGEYEISSIHSYLLKEGKTIGCKEITGWWKDTGKANDLLLANQLLLDALEPAHFEQCETHETANCTGNVAIGKGTRLGEGVTIIGPVIIGENCFIESSAIGPHVTVGTGCEIRKSHIENSIILEGGMLSGVTLSESLLGKKVSVTKRQDQKQQMILGEKTQIEF